MGLGGTTSFGAGQVPGSAVFLDPHWLSKRLSAGLRLRTGTLALIFGGRAVPMSVEGRRYVRNTAGWPSGLRKEWS
jgi:hypothetical protein